MSKDGPKYLDELSANGTVCPICGSDNDDLSFTTITYESADVAFEKVHCDRCGSKWNSVWSPVALTEFKPNVEIRDNGGVTFDRYTIIYPDGSYVAASVNPTHPQGFWQHGEGLEIGGDNHHLGKLITFSELPDVCQRLVIQELQSEFQGEE